MMNFKEILKECFYKTSRSGGAGGQHVNKVETKVEISWNVALSNCLNDKQKALVQEKLAKRINTKGELICTAQKSRSQSKNKEEAQKKLLALVENALVEKQKRKATRVPKGVKEKRLKVKRVKAEHKQNRKKVQW